MRKVNTVIITILLVMIMASSIFFVKKLNTSRLETMYLENKPVKVDTLIVVDTVIVKKLSLEVDKLQLKSSENYNKFLKTITSYGKVIITLQDSIKKLNMKDTTIVHSIASSGTRDFEINKEPFLLKGYFQKQDPWLITFDILSAKTSLDIIATENKFGIWDTFITTGTKDIAISGINAKYKKFDGEPKNFILGTQAIMNNNDFTTSLIAGYNKSAMIIGYGTQGVSIGAIYFFIK